MHTFLLKTAIGYTYVDNCFKFSCVTVMRNVSNIIIKTNNIINAIKLTHNIIMKDLWFRSQNIIRTIFFLFVVISMTFLRV